MSGEIENENMGENIDNSNENNTNENDIKKKICISNLISGALLVHKRGGLNLFQSRDLANAIDSFSDLNNETQLENINLIILVLEIGQSKGIFDINESRSLANILDILSDDEKLSQMEIDKFK